MHSPFKEFKLFRSPASPTKTLPGEIDLNDPEVSSYETLQIIFLWNIANYLFMKHNAIYIFLWNITQIIVLWNIAQIIFLYNIANYLFINITKIIFLQSKTHIICLWNITQINFYMEHFVNHLCMWHFSNYILMEHYANYLPIDQYANYVYGIIRKLFFLWINKKSIFYGTLRKLSF